MTITNGYCTLDELKAFAMPDTGTNLADDAVIEDIIEGVSRDIDGRCGRVFYQSTTTKYYTAKNNERLRVDDIYTDTGLVIETDYDGDGVYETVLDSGDYNLTPYSPENGWPYQGIERTINAGSFFSRAPKGNKITASFGWSAIPNDIRQVCLAESLSEYKRRFGENVNTVANVTSAGVVLTPVGMSVTSIKRLSRYKKVT